MRDSLPFLVGTADQLERYGVMKFDCNLAADLPSLLSVDYNDDAATSLQEALAGEVSPSESMLLCLFFIPAHMIPTEILHFFSGDLNDIATITVFRHYWQPDKYLALMRTRSVEAAVRLRSNYHGQLISSLDKTLCLLLPVNDVVICRHMDDMMSLIYPDTTSDSIEEMALQIKQPSETNMDALHAASSPHSRDLRAFIVGQDVAVSPYSPSSSPLCTTSSQTVGTMQKSGAEVDDESGPRCPVCLEPMPLRQPMSFTTCCQHTFHTQCVVKLEGPQCPVCRFQHDTAPANVTECSVCGWSGVAPTNHETASESNMNHVAVSRFGGQAQQVHDVWVCLICGFTGCGRMHLSHIHSHYAETLHTYAMHTESRRVWDFSGDGYVHRLVLNASGGSPMESAPEGEPITYSSEMVGEAARSLSSARAVNDDSTVAFGGNSLPSMKLVEVNDPHHRTDVRSQQAPLSSEDEENIVNRKLEAAAHHYNQILTWRMEQNRLLYESRLLRIRQSILQRDQHPAKGNAADRLTSAGEDKMEDDKQSVAGDISSATAEIGRKKMLVSPFSNRGSTWYESMIYSLKSELTKIQKQTENARARLERSRKEAEVLRELNSNLERNKVEWRTRIEGAKAELRAAEEAYQNEVPALEKKVEELMTKLDSTPIKETGSKAVPGSGSGVESKEAEK